MGAVRMSLQTADKNITIIYQSAIFDAKSCMFVIHSSLRHVLLQTVASNERGQQGMGFSFLYFFFTLEIVIMHYGQIMF